MPYFNSHRDSALALYRQRAHLQHQPLVDAHFLGRQEQLLFTHLHVLAHTNQTASEPGKEEETFLYLMQLLLSPQEQRRQQGVEQALDCLIAGGAKQQGAFQSLSLLPKVCEQKRLLQLYQETPSLRMLLFQLWQEQQNPVPPALTSVAELRSADPDLQLAALNYAASIPDSGRDLFTPYFQGLNSGINRPENSGRLLATALWGAVLRGMDGLTNPLWRGIESEVDPDALYHLLRLAAIMADPELIPIIQQYAKQHPQRSAELLAIHGSREAIEALLSLSCQQNETPQLRAVWQWISGRQLTIPPTVQLVTANAPTPHREGTIHHWWAGMCSQMQPQDRLLMGKKLTPQHVHKQALQWAGSFSNHLLDLLSFVQGRPTGISARALQTTRQTALNIQTRALAS